ncbi:hypothetical protein GCM10010123_37670 [Pilimelia anulata]|uniref:Secreted protein n=1 Tax=Pilimelia anulata TaxID=53371 RepID=A0A8J3BC46_9ACTN|nr:hypothetical protein [Pilimelia anulata]GGK04180.1 hypothetical protein GCM10010123_37670 [Pilimelia anulata]
MSRILRGLVAALAATTLVAAAVPAAAADADHAHPMITAPDSYVTGEPAGEVEKPAPGASSTLAPPAWRYYITSSCSNLSGSIRRGAQYWGNGTETQGSGTPVECTNGYVQGCGGGSTVVGCNWGSGQRIMLSTKVSDFALLSAHEFGHNWYGHSGSGCADWSSADMVMRTHMC